MLCPYALKVSAEQFNELKVYGYSITPMENFPGKTTDITLKNRHTWGCPVHILDARFQVNAAGIPKWEPRSRAGIYLGHKPFQVGSVALVINPATGRVLPQFHVMLDDEFSTVLFMREGTILPN